jgi:hypothetical protein
MLSFVFYMMHHSLRYYLNDVAAQLQVSHR